VLFVAGLASAKQPPPWLVYAAYCSLKDEQYPVLYRFVVFQHGLKVYEKWYPSAPSMDDNLRLAQDELSQRGLTIHKPVYISTGETCPNKT
jgi:hypothetical protein